MQRSREEVLQVAKAQKGIVWCVAVNMLIAISDTGFFILNIQKDGPPLGLELLPVMVPSFFSMASSLLLFMVPFLVYFVYRLTGALKWKYPVLWAIGWVLGSFIYPLANLVVLLVLNLRANQALKEAGFRVGFFGARISDIEQSMLAEG